MIGELKFHRKEGYTIKTVDIVKSNNISHSVPRASCIGIKKLSIETGAGEFFAPARKLFKNSGFKPCEPFAHYKKDPNSCYFTLNL